MNICKASLGSLQPSTSTFTARTALHTRFGSDSLDEFRVNVSNTTRFEPIHLPRILPSNPFHLNIHVSLLSLSISLSKNTCTRAIINRDSFFSRISKNWCKKKKLYHFRFENRLNQNSRKRTKDENDGQVGKQIREIFARSARIFQLK